MLEVRQQVRLSFRRLLEICLDSISYRLLRSVVTVCIIVLAIAFLSVIMVEGYLGRGIRDAVLSETARMTAHSRFLTQASRVDTPERLVEEFARVEEGTAASENLRRWGGFDAEAARDFVAHCARVRQYLRFFQEIPIGNRVLLVGQETGAAIFDRLMDPGRRAEFAQRIAPMKNLQLPGGMGGFDAFLAEWPAFRERLHAVRQGYVETVERIREFCGEQGVGGRLKAAVAAGAEREFFQRLGELGLRVETEHIGYIVEGVAYDREREWAFNQLRKSPVRTGWNREFQERFSPGEAVVSCADRPGRVGWIQRVLEEDGQAEDFDAARFLRFAREYRLRRRRLDDETALLLRYGQTERLSEKTVWLISVSFLVCVVGIANAMLMSVLERFKEIATMKCLGARNETIAFLFVTESLIIGVVGGLVGLLLGFLIVFGRLGISYGGLLFANVPWADLLVTFVVGFCCSLLLATLAAIYPAWVASRMAPMEAMRVD